MNGTTATDPDPPPSNSPGPGPYAKRLYRDPRGPIGGVASGFAGYFNIDPVITRLMWVAALFSGIGFPAYILCWVVIPKAPSWPPPGYQPRAARAHDPNDKSLVSGLVIVVLAAAIGAGVKGAGEYLLPAALVGLGLFLLNQQGAASVPPAVPGAPSSPAGGGAAPAIERTGLVTPTVLSLLAFGTGLILALHAAGVVNVPVRGAAAAGLVLIGAGLIASLWLGRARGLVPLGLAFASVMIVASATRSWNSTECARRFRERMHATASKDSSAVGDHSFAPKSLAELRPRYDLGLGKLSVDLSQLDFTGEQREVELDVGMGEALLLVPLATSVSVTGSVGMGEAHALGRNADGLSVLLEHEDAAQGQGRLRVKVTVGLGKWEVRRGS